MVGARVILILLILILDTRNTSAQIYYDKTARDLSKMSWIQITPAPETNPSFIECGIHCISDGACFGFGYIPGTEGNSCILFLPSSVSVNKGPYPGYEYFLSSNLPYSCDEFDKDGITPLLLKGGTLVVAKCRKKTQGTWLVFQERQNSLVNFNQTWTKYKHGFGDLQGDFWWGNEMLHLATSATEGEFALDVRLTCDDGYTKREMYFPFHVANEQSEYTLKRGLVQGDTPRFDWFLWSSGGQKFTTYDRGCPDTAGGWWDKTCIEVVNLNGHFGGSGKADRSLVHVNLGRPQSCWTSSEMMFAKAKLGIYHLPSRGQTQYIDII